MSFDGLGLSPELLRAVSDEGYTEPTPVQAAAIPVILEAATSSPARRPGPARRPRSCCRSSRPSTPPGVTAAPPATRSASSSSFRRASCAPGRGERPDLRQAPPDPLDDGLRRRRLRPPGLEAPRGPRDRGRDPRPAARPRQPAHDRPVAGRGPHPRRGRPPPRHGLHPRHPQDHRPAPAPAAEPAVLGDLLGRRPAARRRPAPRSGARIQVTPRNTTAELIDQLVIPVDRERKRDLLRELVALGRVKQALVFTRTKHGANRLAEKLGKDGIKAAAIHGNKSQNQRVKALDDFKAGRVDDPRRDRRRRARPRHRAAPARHQLRAADGPRGLRPPHRPHRPRRRRRPGDLARVRRREAAPPGDPAAPPARDPAGDDRGLRARPVDPARADPAPLHARPSAPSRPLAVAPQAAAVAGAVGDPARAVRAPRAPTAPAPHATRRRSRGARRATSLDPPARPPIRTAARAAATAVAAAAARAPAPRARASGTATARRRAHDREPAAVTPVVRRRVARQAGSTAARVTARANRRIAAAIRPTGTAAGSTPSREPSRASASAASARQSRGAGASRPRASHRARDPVPVPFRRVIRGVTAASARRAGDPWRCSPGAPSAARRAADPWTCHRSVAGRASRRFDKRQPAGAILGTDDEARRSSNRFAAAVELVEMLGQALARLLGGGVEARQLEHAPVLMIGSRTSSRWTRRS